MKGILTIIFSKHRRAGPLPAASMLLVLVLVLVLMLVLLVATWRVRIIESRVGRGRRGVGEPRVGVNCQ